MTPFRVNSVLLSDKVMFYANILRKALVKGTDASMTNDGFIDAELTDRWEKAHPELLVAWEKNNELRQANKKAYAENEAEAIKAISPVPGGRLEPMVE